MKNESIKYIWELVLMVNVFVFLHWLTAKAPWAWKNFGVAVSFGSSFFAAVQLVLWSL